MIAPPPVRPGDPIALVAPSSPFDRTLALRGAGWLAERYRVDWDRAALGRTGYLAGPDARRLAEVERALAGPARAVVAFRGGYGLSRFSHRIDWGRALRDPKWIVGFSDLTVLHVEAARAGLCSLHAPMVCGLGRGDARARERWTDAIERPAARRRWEGLAGWRGGAADGPLFGGNLTCLHACAAAGRLELPDGAIVLLEDIGERPYRVDRMLTTLAAGGHLARAAGFVVGDFLDCAPGPDGVAVEDVLRDRLCGMGVPVVAGFPVGHGTRNDPVVLGARARIDAGAGVCEVGGE